MDSKKGKNKPIKKQNEAKNNNKIVHGKKESKDKKKEDVKKSITEGGVQQKEIKEIKNNNVEEKKEEVKETVTIEEMQPKQEEIPIQETEKKEETNNIVKEEELKPNEEIKENKEEVVDQQEIKDEIPKEEPTVLINNVQTQEMIKDKKEVEEETKVNKETRPNNPYLSKTRQYLKTLSTKYCHKTAKDLQRKKELIFQYIDKELKEISTSSLQSSKVSTMTKKEIKTLETNTLGQINQLSQALESCNLIDDSVQKKISNYIFAFKGQIKSLIAPKVKPNNENVNTNQPTKLAKANEYNKTVTLTNTNVLEKQKKSKFKLLQYPLHYYLPKLGTLSISLDQSADPSNFADLPSSLISSIQILGTSQNLFYALGMNDLLLITDSQMTIIDKFVFDKHNTPVDILYTSIFLIFLYHNNKFYIFDYKTKTEKHVTVSHQICQVCPITYYKDTFCLIDSNESLSFVDYVKPKHLFKVDLNVKKNIFAKYNKYTNILSVGDYVILAGETLKSFSIVNKKLIAESGNFRFNAEKRVINIKNIVLNSNFISDNFLCTFSNGNICTYNVDSRGLITESHSYSINYINMEIGKNLKSNVIITRKNLVIYSYGKNLLIYNIKVKSEAEIELDEVRKGKSDLNIRAMFENDETLILHGDKLIENIKFIDIEEVLSEDTENEVLPIMNSQSHQLLEKISN